MNINETLPLIDIFRVTSATFLGVAVGAERQWRARNAGVRTNALVAAGAALFVLLSSQGFSKDTGTPDPTRVAAQIVSGIGFLGGGVIMRDGLNIRGVNTAATLWCSAAIGALSGAGMIGVAIVGTIIVLIVNSFMRYFGRIFDRKEILVDEHPVLYIIKARVPGEYESKIRTVIVHTLTDTEFQLRSVESEHIADGETVVITVTVYAEVQDDRRIESTINSLSALSDVLSVSWELNDSISRKATTFISRLLLHRENS